MVVPSGRAGSAIAFLNPLFELSKYFGILLPNLQKNRQNCRGWKVYSLIFTSSMWIVYLLSLHGKVSTFYYTLNYFALCMDVLCDLFLILADTFSICYCTFIKPKLSNFFIDVLEEGQIHLPKKIHSFKRRVFYVEFSVIFVLLICYHAYNTYAFATKLKKPPYGVILRVVSHYIVVAAVYQMYNFALLIRDKYRTLNKRLSSGIKGVIEFKGNVSALSQNVDSYLVMYSRCCDAVDAFNIIFGNQIFCIIGFVVINTVEGVQLGLICLTRNALPFISNNCSVIGIAIACETAILAVSICSFFTYV